MDVGEQLRQHWYLEPALAFARGHLSNSDGLLSDEAVLAKATDAGLPMHRFKRRRVMPRIRKVVGALQGMNPATVLDIGSGRGTALWPMMDQLPSTAFTAVDCDGSLADDLQNIARRVARLTAHRMDAGALVFSDATFDVVTALEVLEHLADPRTALRQVFRITRRFVIVSVPSKDDKNPEHRHTFTEQELSRLLLDSGAAKITFDYVPCHMIGICRR